MTWAEHLTKATTLGCGDEGWAWALSTNCQKATSWTERWVFLCSSLCQAVDSALGLILSSFPPVSPRFGCALCSRASSQSANPACRCHSVFIYRPTWMVSRYRPVWSSGLTTVSVFDPQVFVFLSLLYWALQSITQLLAIKKKINWAHRKRRNCDDCNVSHCFLIALSILTNQLCTLIIIL